MFAIELNKKVVGEIELSNISYGDKKHKVKIWYGIY